MLLLLTKSEFPQGIIDYLISLNSVIFSFDFIPFKNVSMIDTQITKLDFKLNNNALEPFGIKSGSSLIN